MLKYSEGWQYVREIFTEYSNFKNHFLDALYYIMTLCWVAVWMRGYYLVLETILFRPNSMKIVKENFFGGD
jgi:hypothetical protein